MQQQTPGVYINEQNAFPNSVVEVATAVPVFIGYTARASYNGQDLTRKPQRVTSLKEYETYFGQGAVPVFDLKEQSPGGTAPESALPIRLQLTAENPPGPATPQHYVLVPADGSIIYYLYNSLRLFYQNGGATCYIVSLGQYGSGQPQADDFIKAIDSLIYEPEPTLLVCPDALCLSQADYYTVVQHMLAHCNDTQSRMAVLDVYQGAVTDPRSLSRDDNPITRFRAGVSNNYLNYGAAYFPWVHTTVVGDAETSFQNMSPALLDTWVTAADAAVEAAESAVATQQQPLPALRALRDLLTAAQRLHEPGSAAGAAAASATTIQWEISRLHNALLASSRNYARISDAITRYRNTLPVAAAMAGVFTAVDTNRGVWKAPANVSLSGVLAPTVSLSDQDQARLNVDAVSGKSVNAIRPFPGLGVLVWGARTLDGNSQDWRYINVRRTMLMLEQSIKLAARAYVFEPNTANTWVTVQSMISSFLFNLWKQGALAGSKPDDAYSVAVGLGSTMTADDILNGYLNVVVKVAISRPAEFIILSFQQQMQKS